MKDQARALKLIERIYQAVVEPDAWNDFLRELSEALDGAGVQISLRIPDQQPSPDDYYSYGLDESYRAVFIKLALEGLPWASVDDAMFRGRFGSAEEMLANQSVAETSLYLDFMRPQGLAATWPICHIIAAQDGRPVSGVVIYARENRRAIDADDMAMLDALVPHLSRVYAIYLRMRRAHQETDALKKTINRLPTGVLLLDGAGNVTLANVSAEDILALEDGFALRRGKPWIADERRNRTLQEAIQSCLVLEPRPGAAVGEVMIVPRPSGRRGFSIMISPLLRGEGGEGVHEAKAILFIADPESGQIGTTEVLESLYQLTRAEADLVRLIAEGRSLDQVAEQRGVTMNTVRSQLKQVFSKTDTRRQGELVHLVLAGVARIREHVQPDHTER